MFSVSTLPKRFFGLIACLGLMAGCIKSPLKKNITLAPLTTGDYERTIDNITLRAHPLSQQESKDLLGKNPRSTRVVQISFTNTTDTCWNFEQNFNDHLPLLSNKTAMKLFLPEVSRNINAPAMADVHIAARNYIFFPTALLGLSSAQAVLIATTGAVPALLPISLITLTIVSIVPAVKILKKANRDIDVTRTRVEHAIKQLSPEIMEIKPHATQSMLLFVDGKHLPPSFDITIHEAGNPTNTRTFSVQI